MSECKMPLTWPYSSTYVTASKEEADLMAATCAKENTQVTHVEEIDEYVKNGCNSISTGRKLYRVSYGSCKMGKEYEHAQEAFICSEKLNKIIGADKAAVVHDTEHFNAYIVVPR